MKPVVIIAIAVVCSVIAMLGILFVIDYNNNQILLEYNQDVNRALSLKLQWMELTKEYCMRILPPTTYSEGIEAKNESQRVLELVTKNEKGNVLSEIKSEMEQLAKKYSDYKYFVLEDASCIYEKEWDEWYDVAEQVYREMYP
jgi:hypothetical protein